MCDLCPLRRAGGLDKAAQHPLHVNTLKVLAVVAFLSIHAW